jgi:hypothetical protein
MSEMGVDKVEKVEKGLIQSGAGQSPIPLQEVVNGRKSRKRVLQRRHLFLPFPLLFLPFQSGGNARPQVVAQTFIYFFYFFYPLLAPSLAGIRAHRALASVAGAGCRLRARRQLRLQSGRFNQRRI